MKFVRKSYIQETVELNITAFMNLMVILVPFLLITAVFSRLTVLELNLPALDAAAAKQENKIKLQLQLIIRAEEFIVQDANIGVIKRFQREQAEAKNWKEFGNILLEIKRRFPDENSITLLFEKKVNYKTLIQVMDHVRSIDVVQVAEVETIELFPNISIGDAPTISENTQVQTTSSDEEQEDSSNNKEASQ
ncbi:ExbD/TolR family protein [Aliikangiella sp. IMCC44359]|uniref:ExbD/TolR family protein n=1 Tax=Aliikangiella sp. IMCC44359 TaxID=3459125 RepID=UPI00403AD8C9